MNSDFGNKTSTKDWYPFDGTCNCSKDANFALRFDDKTCLKISKCVLELASPVFKTAIRDCEHDGTLHLSDTSQSAWVLILNYIHPAGRSVSLADTVVKGGWTLTADVLRQCEKFGFLSLKDDLDGRLAKAIDAMHPALQRVTSSDSERYILLSVDMDILKAVKEFELPRCEEAVVAYLVVVVQENRNSTFLRSEKGHKRDNSHADTSKNRIVRIICEMHDAGRYRLCSAFLQATIKKDLYLPYI